MEKQNDFCSKDSSSKLVHRSSQSFKDYSIEDALKKLPKIPFVLDKAIETFINEKNYEIKTKLNEGAFAEVYNAYDMKRNRKCAAKIINISNMHTMFRTKYLPRELRILYDVRHQYLIEIYDIFNVDNLIFIFMEFATKSDLCDYLIRTARALSEPHSCKWFWQISTALNYLHCNKCIAHRDIKIENILITEDYTTKLTDFGFSAYVFMDGNNEPEQSHTYCGTKPYKSIQIAQMRPYNPFKADIWALGVVLFLLLNNHYPFHYNDMKLMVNEQLDCNFIPRRLKPTLSNSSKQLIMEMFEIDETKRIDTVNILKHQWLIEYLDQSLVISE